MISVLLFTAVAVLAFTGLFDLVETRFYNPSIVTSLSRETARDAEIIQSTLLELKNRFADSLAEPPVRRSFLPNQQVEDLIERFWVYENLLILTGGLHSVRFVDAGGERIHFSTHDPDSVNQDRFSAEYREYTDDPSNLPFEAVSVPELEPGRLILDPDRDRLIFAFPFYDSMDVYRGTALFTISARALVERLLSAGRIKASETITLVSAPPGILSGVPEGSKNETIARVSAIWGNGLLSLTPFDSAVPGIRLALISARTSQGVFYGRVVAETLFAFPLPMKALLLVSTFLTIYLALFFLFSIRQDALTIIKNRLQELQIALIEQFYASKGEMDWARWTMELEQRRKGVRAEVKRGINIKRCGYSEAELDSLIDNSWTELLALIGARQHNGPGIDEEKLRHLLNRAIRSRPPALKASTKTAGPTKTAAPAETTASARAVEVKMPPDLINNGTPAAELLPVEEELDWSGEPETAGFGGEEAAPVQMTGEETVSRFADLARDDNISFFENEEMEATPEPAPPEEDRPGKTGGLLAMATHKRTVLVPAAEDETLEELETPDESDNPGPIDEIEALEELEMVEELEELETAADADPFGETAMETDSSTPASPRPSAQEIKELESSIEFSETVSDPEDAEDILPAELEIVSPLSSMFSPLETVTILQEPDGIPHINHNALSPDQETEAGLDPDFKKLVGSVIKT